MHVPSRRAGGRVRRVSLQGCAPHSAPNSFVLSTHGQLKLSIDVKESTLGVHVMEAKGLMGKEFQTCNSYVKLALVPDLERKQRCRTRTVPDCKGPVFHEHLAFVLQAEDEQKRLLIGVWSFDRQSRHSELLGCMSFGVRSLMMAAKDVSGWYYLLAEELGRTKHLKFATRRFRSHRDRLGQISWPASANVSSCGQRTVKVMVSRGADGFGFTIHGKDPVRVQSVDSGSPAEGAGLRPLDAIVELNGRPVSTWSCEELAFSIHYCPHSVVLGVERCAGWGRPVATDSALQPSSQHAPGCDRTSGVKGRRSRTTGKENEFPAGTREPGRGVIPKEYFPASGLTRAVASTTQLQRRAGAAERSREGAASFPRSPSASSSASSSAASSTASSSSSSCCCASGDARGGGPAPHGVRCPTQAARPVTERGVKTDRRYSVGSHEPEKKAPGAWGDFFPDKRRCRLRLGAHMAEWKKSSSSSSSDDDDEIDTQPLGHRQHDQRHRHHQRHRLSLDHGRGSAGAGKAADAKVRGYRLREGETLYPMHTEHLEAVPRSPDTARPRLLPNAPREGSFTTTSVWCGDPLTPRCCCCCLNRSAGSIQAAAAAATAAATA
ncbi:uncharacterized protein LOC116955441 isoform X1 [Petromyzon marinus]|uniref:uncharacterized protein LOC116955441 isoform X1 n=2 Tax=Petromyzon marinus TaxID=7757 RepID=UPI003F72097A